MTVALLFITIVLGTALFATRQYRLELAYDVAQLHRQIGRCRANLWDMQVRIANLARPSELQQAILSTKLHLEPVVSTGVGPHRLAAAQSQHGGRRHEGY